MNDVTQILGQIEQGDASAADELLPLEACEQKTPCRQVGPHRLCCGDSGLQESPVSELT